MSEMPPPTIPPATPPPPGGGSYTPPPPPPPGGLGGGPASSDRTLMIVLSYLWLLALIPYFTKKDDPDAEVRWHAKNGVGLLLLDIALWVLFFVVGIILRRVPMLGCGVGVVQCVLWLGLLALHIYCLIKAVNGQRVRIPMVTDFAEKSL
jgi:uncharacterized membrane protein